MDNAGSFQWINFGTTVFRVGGISADASGNSYITGTFEYMFILGTDTLYSPSGSYDREPFVAKLDPSGTAEWCRRAGGIDQDHSFAVQVDAQDNIYFAGDFKVAAGFGNDTLITDIVPAMFVSKINGNAVGIKSLENEYPNGYGLYQNYPNPFNPKTVIRYQLPEAGQVEVSVYNSIGQKVRVLVSENQAGGDYSVEWDGNNDHGQAVSGGLYLYQIRTQSYNASRKMILLR
jgi:hypothetical protein